MTTARVPPRIGLYLAVLQFFFALSWVVYVIYLPQLAESAGLPRRVVPWLLMADQLIFIVCDAAVGIASDRAAAILGRIGRWVAVATVLSMLAFVALPFLVSLATPAARPWALCGLTVLWAATMPQAIAASTSDDSTKGMRGSTCFSVSPRYGASADAVPLPSSISAMKKGRDGLAT
jgi:MFS family permease